jgi:hypothetical protein
VWLMRLPPEKTTLRISASSDKQIGKADWGRTILLCNTWNSTNDGPKAYLSISESEDENALIDLDIDLGLEPGIHQELLDGFIDDAFTGIWAFWEWVHQEHGI